MTDNELKLLEHIETLTTAIEDVLTILEEWPLTAAQADRAYKLLADAETEVWETDDDALAALLDEGAG